jgi:hypothetical protein
MTNIQSESNHMNEQDENQQINSKQSNNCSEEGHDSDHQHSGAD